MKKINIFIAPVLLVLAFIALLFFKYQKPLSQTQTIQEPVISIGTVSGVNGSTVDLPISFMAGTNEVSSLQFDLSIPSGLGYISISKNVVAGKTVQANVMADKLRVIVFDLNRTPINTGQIAVIKLKIASSVPNNAFNLNLSNILASSPDATVVKASGLNGKIKVQPQ